jgi:hypothetical protein
MSFRAIYKCDICREDTHKGDIMGVRFYDMRRFTLAPPESTDGIHICNLCLGQLREQLGPKQVQHGEKHG